MPCRVEWRCNRVEWQCNHCQQQVPVQLSYEERTLFSPPFGPEIRPRPDQERQVIVHSFRRLSTMNCPGLRTRNHTTKSNFAPHQHHANVPLAPRPILPRCITPPSRISLALFRIPTRSALHPHPNLDPASHYIFQPSVELLPCFDFELPFACSQLDLLRLTPFH